MALAWLVVNILGAPAILGGLTLLEHDQVCPGCGGWGAGVANVAAGVALLGSIFALVAAIRSGAGIISIVVASLAVAAGSLFLVTAIGFYFAIQA